MRKPDRTDYEPLTPRNQLGSFDRYLRQNDYVGYGVVLLGKDFQLKNKALKSKQKLLKSEVRGNQLVESDIPTSDELGTFYKLKQLGPHNPTVVLNKLWFNSTLKVSVDQLWNVWKKLHNNTFCHNHWQIFTYIFFVFFQRGFPYVPVGIHKLGKLMKHMYAAAGIDKRTVTNHGALAFMMQHMVNTDTDASKMIKISNHKNLPSVNNYSIASNTEI